jgi:hyperosmotically inducible protein
MHIQTLRYWAATTVVCLATYTALAQSPSSSSTGSSAIGGVPADNTKTNRDYSSNTAVTADAQKEDTMDRTITQNIRKSVVADKSLSTYAHNVKIVTVNGTVTLNGVVRSDQEKTSVAEKAASVVGQARVVNDLKVTPPKS